MLKSVDSVRLSERRSRQPALLRLGVMDDLASAAPGLAVGVDANATRQRSACGIGSTSDAPMPDVESMI